MTSGIVLLFFAALLFLLPASTLANISAPSVGEETTFVVDAAYDLKNRSSITAVHEFSGEKAYIYIDKAYLAGLAPEEKAAFLQGAGRLLVEFDTRIYPLITQTFGTPWEPGIDGDLRITILLTQLSEQTAGYFNPRDEFEKSNVPDSNEREMIYLNTRFIAGDRAKIFLAHEFQHLVSFYWKEKVLGTSDDVWLNEVRSEYVPTLLGYDAVYSGSNLEHRVSIFLRSPADSLTEWRNTPYDYGPVTLFGQYLADRFSANIFREMMRAKSVGFASVEEATKILGKPAQFKDIFTDWLVANYLNDISSDARYGYLNARLRTFRLSPTDFSSATGEVAFSMKDWSNTAYRIFGTASGTLSVSLALQDAAAPFRAVLIRTEAGESSVQFGDGGPQGIVLTSPLSANAVYLVLPFSNITTSSFTDNEPARNYTLRIANSPIPQTLPTEALSTSLTPTYPEGSLIRARGDYKVYITKGQFKRHIVSAEIFKFYGHLGFARQSFAPQNLGGFAQVIEVSPEELAQYKPSAWVRADGDPRVWEINGDGTKHWINISGEQFAPSGRDWNGVYIINARERDWYRQGADVLR